MSNAASWATTAGNKFREVARTTESLGRTEQNQLLTQAADLRLLAAVRAGTRDEGGELSSRQVDERRRDGERDC
jgi:hypothetical protein